jgi:hypothetical protein
MLLSHLVFLYLVETILTKVLLDLIVKTVYIYIVLVSLYFCTVIVILPRKIFYIEILSLSPTPQCHGTNPLNRIVPFSFWFRNTH